MTYTTLMVHLEPGRSNAGVLNITSDLAERYRANVIGIVACQPMQLVEGDDELPAVLIEANRLEIARELKEAEAEFRSTIKTSAQKLQWRAMACFENLSAYISHEARCADLIITKVPESDLLDGWRRVSMASLVMQAGRPVLVVPAAGRGMKLESMVVAWKDTREARRATVDALPLLKLAAEVTIVEIAVEADLAAARRHLEDVATWLEGHGITAAVLAVLSSGDDASALREIAMEKNADLIVAGAYGHSRLREFVLGGVSHDLLLCANRCALISH